MAADVIERPVEPPHRLRFFAIYGVLGLALGGAAAALAIGITAHGGGGGARWSAWRPTRGGLGAAQQIAQHVGGEYHLSNGNQLVDVIAKAPSVSANGTTFLVGYVAVEGKGGTPDQIESVSGENSVMYTLCGLGVSCTIPTGKASAARGRIVLREILELALYTFHYDPGIDSVIALMPPRSETAAPALVYILRSSLGPELSRPLDRTLSPQAPLPGTMDAQETQLVETAAARRAFSFSLTRAQDGNAILILTHLKA